MTHRTLFHTALSLAFAALLAAPVPGAEALTRPFDVPAGDAAVTLRRFAGQADEQIVFPAEVVRGVQTHSVRGEFTAREALDRMLNGTDLVAVQDPASGALAVRRRPPADEAGAPGSRPAADDPATPVPGRDALSHFHPRTTEETVTLNPFEVQADSDKSYGAVNSNSITSFSTALEKLPISADVFDQAFMDDIGEIRSVEDMIQTYSAGAGADSSNPGLQATISQPGERGGGTGLRGLSIGSTRRDTFISLVSTGTGATSTFDIERVEIINGPQSLLYGSGGAGGAINLVSKQARLGTPEFASAEYQVDQYGHKLGQFDYGVGTDRLAVRVAVIDQDWGTRLQWAGGPLTGQYVQLAAKVFGHTVIRVTGEDSSFRRIVNVVSSLTVTAPSAANDARNGQRVNYLLATNQIQSSATGASGMGVIDNGLLNWGNDQVTHGWWGLENTFNQWTTLTAQTQWSKSLSTEFDAGFNIAAIPRSAENLTTIDAPNVAANPTGTWAMPDTGARPVQSQIVQDRNKAARFTALLTNDIFTLGHSQTILGTDFTHSSSTNVSYTYFQADSNWNAIYSPSVTINNGRTIITAVYIPLANGPIKYPYWAPFSDRVTYNGVRYVRQIQNLVDPNLIAPVDPLGITTFGGGNYALQKTIDKGYFAVNDSDWFDGRLETLLGLRITKDFTVVENSSAPPQNVYVTRNTATSYNAGANYRLLSWLRPYVSFSDSYQPPTASRGDVFGNQLGSSQGIGEEAGLKISSSNGAISGSLAYYAVQSKNESVAMTSTLMSDINPSGLNGRYGSSPSVYYNVDRKSSGVQAGLTAEPTGNWRVRLSAAYINGTIGTSLSYNPVYNDQFHENSAGQVTYADGTVVYVPATFNSKQLIVSSTTPGAVPLTVALMNNSSSQYYANPVAITGQIRATSNAGVVLLSPPDPVHGAILTGATGLPISQIQINPGFTPPSVIPVSVAGDDTVGYPEFSLSLTNLYTFSQGWMKGVKIGGTVALSSRVRSYYYYPHGLSVGALDALYTMPNRDRFDLILGYERRLKRFTWSTQLNVNNLFNRYHVVILPDPVNGFSGIDDATFDQQPRFYQWTNRISF